MAGSSSRPSLCGAGRRRCRTRHAAAGDASTAGVSLFLACKRRLPLSDLRSFPFLLMTLGCGTLHRVNESAQEHSVGTSPFCWTRGGLTVTSLLDEFNDPGWEPRVASTGC